MGKPTGREISAFKGHNGTMVFDGESVTVSNKYRSLKGLAPVLIPLESIESVFIKQPTVVHSNGHIRIVTPNETGPVRLTIREAPFHDKTLMVLIGKGASAKKFAEDVMQAVRARGAAAVPFAPCAENDTEFRSKHGIPAEAVLAVGVNGYCSFDGRYLTLQPLGLGRFTVGKGVKRIPVESISAIQMKPAGSVVNGFIQFTVPGGNERRSEFGRQTLDAAGDENSLIFTQLQEANFVSLRDAIEAARDSPVTAPGSPILNQLAQLAELRDSGIVTAEEFDAKKAELLGRL
jgi:hypothetical protein